MSDLRTYLAQVRASHKSSGQLSTADSAFILEASLKLLDQCEELERAEEQRERDVVHWQMEVQRLAERC